MRCAPFGLSLQSQGRMWAAVFGGVAFVLIAGAVWLGVTVKGWAGKGVPGLHRYGFSEFKRLWVERGAQVCGYVWVVAPGVCV